MTHKLLALKSKLDQLDAEKKERLLSFLPEETKESLHKFPPLDHIKHIGFASRAALLKNIDESWYEDAFQGHGKDDIELLKKVLKHSFEKESSVNKIAMQYTQDLVIRHLANKESLPLPRSFTSPSPVDFLLEISLPELLKLCRFLGLYDISIEVKKIIKSAQIKRIEESFVAEEIQFLNKISKEPQPVSFIEIGLSHWDGDVEKLREIILLRGMNRLAKALCQVGGTFLWYFVHKLPKFYASQFRRFHKPVAEKKVVEILMKQVETTWEHIKE